MSFNALAAKAAAQSDLVERFYTYGVSLSYLAGFSSMYVQTSGLQGVQGILNSEEIPWHQRYSQTS